MKNLASSGLNAAQSIQALIPSLNLAEAAAGEIDVAGATELTSSIAASWGSSAGNFSNISDVLTRMKQLSSFNFNELGPSFRGVSATAKVANQDFEQIAAGLSIMRTQGETAVGAGEKYRIALNALSTPSSGATKAIKTLGVEIRENGTGAMRNYLDIFQDLNLATSTMTEGQRAHTLNTILGTEGIKAYLSATSATLKVTQDGQKVQLSGINVLRHLQSEYENAGGSTNAFASIQRNTTAGQIKLLEGTWETIKIVFGQTFIPLLAGVVKGLRLVLDPLLALINSNETLRKSIGWIVGATTGWFLISGAVKTARATMGLYRLMTLTTTTANKGLLTSLWTNRTAHWANIKAMAVATGSYIRMASVKAWQTAVTWSSTVATWASTAAMWAFNAAMSVNPITWVVVGIVALVGAIVGLIYYWDEVVASLTNAWNWFVELVKTTTWLKVALTILTGPIGALILYWDAISLAVSKAWKVIKQSISSLLDWFGNLGSKLWQTFVSGLKSGFNVVKHTVSGLLGEVRKFLPFSDAKEGPLSSLTKSGMSFTKTFASGITKASPDLKSKAQQLLGSINLTPKLPKLNTTNENNLVQNFQKSGGANITTGSLITLNINGSSEKIAVNALSRKLAELLTGEINKLEVY